MPIQRSGSFVPQNYFVPQKEGVLYHKMSRPTEGYENTVKVRLTREQRESLESEACERGISLSEVIRERLSFVPQNSEGFVPQNNYVPQNCIEVSESVYRSLVDEARECDLSVGDLLEEKLENNEVPKTMYEEELNKMSGKLGVDELTLLDIMGYLIESEKLYRDERGKLRIKGMNVDPEYISVDEKIDELKVSQKQKDFMKRQILGSLSAMKEQSVGTVDWA